MEKTLGYHFTDGMKLRDGQELIIGKTYVHEGPIEICKSGLHASRRVIDAMIYAPNCTLSIVECSDIEEEHYDKFVCRERKVLETHDVTRLLQDFALDVAEEVIEKIWNVEDTRPQDALRIARLYLEGEVTLEEYRKVTLYDYLKAHEEARKTIDFLICPDRYFYVAAAAYAASAVPYTAHVPQASRSTVLYATDAHFPFNFFKTFNEYNSQLTQRLQKVFKTSLDF